MNKGKTIFASIFVMTLEREATMLYKYFRQKDTYFVTRDKDNMPYEVNEFWPVNKGSGRTVFQVDQIESAY